MLSRLSRLLHTFTFRLALIYVALFSFSVVLLFGFTYSSARRYMESQIAESIRVQYQHLLNEYRENGSAGVEQRIAGLIASDTEGSEIYLLINRESERLAGNLEAWPQYAVKEGSIDKGGEWVRFSIEGTRSNPAPIEVKAITIPLSKWRSLLVGQSLQDQKKIEQTIIQTFWASLIVTILMAFGGAVVITRSVIRRINIINRSAHTIMHGNLGARIPYTRGGDEFDELSANLNEMLDKIETLLKSLKDFANNIAHDLRSPLNRIVSRTEAGLRGVRENSAVRRLLENNVREMGELIATFNSILKISELEANTDFRDFAPCDLTALLANLVEFYEPMMAEKHIALVTEVQQELRIEGEKHLLTQAFANLLDNAVKFTPEGGEIRVLAKREEETVRVIITDTGPGIPLEFREKVFEKFFRMEFSRNTKGNGLGLSLVAAVARIHNAHIQLEDNGPGLRVNIAFAALGDA